MLVGIFGGSVASLPGELERRAIGGGLEVVRRLQLLANQIVEGRHVAGRRLPSVGIDGSNVVLIRTILVECGAIAGVESLIDLLAVAIDAERLDLWLGSLGLGTHGAVGLYAQSTFFELDSIQTHGTHLAALYLGGVDRLGSEHGSLGTLLTLNGSHCHGTDNEVVVLDCGGERTKVHPLGAVGEAYHRATFDSGTVVEENCRGVGGQCSVVADIEILVGGDST